MTGRAPSIRDVATLARVSTATVSNVFSGRKPVNDDRRQRVLDAARALDYRADRAASQLRSGRTRTVAVLVPDLTDTFFATIVSRLETMAYDRGYDVIVASSRDDRAVEASRLAALLAWRPAGLVAVPCSDRVPDLLASRRGDLPTVLVDRVIPDGAIADTVTIDNHDAGEIAARHLVEHGHRDIVLAGSHLDIAPIRERVRGAAGLIRGETGRDPTILALGSSAEPGATAFARWLERHPVPDAVVAFTNVTTLSVLSALARFRIPIPGRTSVLAFDDDAWMSARNTGLTAIRQPVEAIARTAWERLASRMDGETVPPRSVVLNAGLVVRDSVKPRAGAGGEARAPGPDRPPATESAGRKPDRARVH